MKLSISNIAWGASDDEAVYTLLKKYGYQGIDIAPSRIWNDIYNVQEEEVQAFRDLLATDGLVVAGMQSLLFKRTDLTIFESETQREATKIALKHMIDIGSWVGAHAVVFGSPKNRIMGEASDAKRNVATHFFRELGEYAHARGVSFCLEPNPSIYGGDFLTHTKETFDFVKRVNSPGLKVNLDMGTCLCNGEDVPPLIAKHIELVGHVHVSMPYLKPIDVGEMHRTITKSLAGAAYTQWITIEMAPIEGENRLAVIEGVLDSVAGMVKSVV